jgi:hypothetical protein
MMVCTKENESASQTGVQDLPSYPHTGHVLTQLVQYMEILIYISGLLLQILSFYDPKPLEASETSH